MSTTVKFYTVSEFKSLVGCTAATVIEVVKNPTTGKLFVSVGGTYFKCQQDIDDSLPMKFLIEHDEIEKACLVNVAESSNVLFTLS